MIINGKAIETFKTILLKVNKEDTEKEIETYWTGLSPFIVPGNNKFKTLELELLLECDTPEELEINRSNLSKEFKECTLEVRGYIYKGTTENIEFEPLTPRHMIINAVVQCTQESEQEVVPLLKQAIQTVFIKGNCEIECIYEITVPVSTSNIRINEIVYDILEPNETLIINGIDKTVTVYGVNKIKNITLTSFPTLKPGNNTITISPQTVNVTLKYSPKWQ